MCFTYSVPLQRVTERNIIRCVFYPGTYSVTHNPKRRVFAGFCQKKMPVYMQGSTRNKQTRTPTLAPAHCACIGNYTVYMLLCLVL